MSQQEITEAIKALTKVVNAKNGMRSESTVKAANEKIQELIPLINKCG